MIKVTLGISVFDSEDVGIDISFGTSTPYSRNVILFSAALA